MTAASGSEPRGCRRSRHWVGLAIVAIQMAAWCLVGTLLMHRGISNLRRRDDALAPFEGGDIETTSTTSVLITTPSPGQDEVAPTSTMPEEPQYPEPTLSRRRNQWSFFPQNSPLRPLLSQNDLETDWRGKPSEGFSPASTVSPPRKVVTTGAATAVVMVTVGGVMLVVGPAFLLIKMIDVYQRQSRLSKLSRQEDPPPSYDEVIEKAPRYSALFQVSDSGELTPLAGPGALPVVVVRTGGLSGDTCVEAAYPALPSEPESTRRSPEML